MGSPTATYPRRFPLTVWARWPPSIGTSIRSTRPGRRSSLRYESSCRAPRGPAHSTRRPADPSPVPEARALGPPDNAESRAPRPDVAPGRVRPGYGETPMLENELPEGQANTIFVSKLGESGPLPPSRINIWNAPWAAARTRTPPSESGVIVAT